MPEKSLRDYVKNLMQKGHDASAIRNFLSRYGYSAKEIDDAINANYKQTIRHEIHLSRTTILVVIFIFASLIGAASFLYYNPSQPKETKLLDVNLEPVTTNVKPGENIVFLKYLSNLGSSARYDVVINQELIDPKTSRVVTQKIETRAIETFGSTQTKILVPKDIKPGDYILRAIVEYDDKKAIATLPVKITAFEKKETCFDGMKNQNEEGIDCGGMCRPCKKTSAECNDNNPCTNDVMENEACANKPIVPCCGNNICEEGEDCNADCARAAPSVSNLYSTATLEDIKETAKSNPSKALQQCSQIEVPDLKDTCIANIGEAQRSRNYCSQIINDRIKDLCYANVAKLTSDSSLCSEVSIDSRRDSCYMGFVLDNKDYTVCDKITNKQLRQSCESLRQLNELNQQNQQG